MVYPFYIMLKYFIEFGSITLTNSQMSAMTPKLLSGYKSGHRNCESIAFPVVSQREKTMPTMLNVARVLT